VINRNLLTVLAIAILSHGLNHGLSQEVWAQSTTPSAAAAASTASQDDVSPDNLKRLQHLETVYFFRQYPQESVTDRLVRLEKFIFGQAGKGDIDGRLTTLEQALAEKDPSTGKLIAPELMKTTEPAKASNPAPNQSSPQTENAAQSAPTQNDNTPIAMMAPVVTPQAGSPTNQPANGNKLIYADTYANRQPATPPDAPIQTLHIGAQRFQVPGAPEAIIKQVSSAMKVDPRQGDFAFQRAKAYIQLKKYDNALTDLNSAIDAVPSNFEYYLARAYVYNQMGNKVLAGQDLKSARFYNIKLPPSIDFDEGLTAEK
jgi:tetratricopeptide (TPR) repeat protein